MDIKFFILFNLTFFFFLYYIYFIYKYYNNENCCKHQGYINLWSLSQRNFDPNKPTYTLEVPVIYIYIYIYIYI